MSEPIVADLFAEDRAHEEFLKPMLYRIAREEGVAISVRVRSARGGHGRAIQEFRNYQKAVECGAIRDPRPDIIVAAIDSNCSTLVQKRKEIAAKTLETLKGVVVAACPDPHVERWYMADPDSFETVVGRRPALGREKCSRDRYKKLLAEAVRQAKHPALLGGIEFAAELVEAMDLYRAGRNESSLHAFIREFRQKLLEAAKRQES
jgi:hypothetical protein